MSQRDSAGLLVILRVALVLFQETGVVSPQGCDSQEVVFPAAKTCRSPCCGFTP